MTRGFETNVRGSSHGSGADIKKIVRCKHEVAARPGVGGSTWSHYYL